MYLKFVFSFILIVILSLNVCSQNVSQSKNRNNKIDNEPKTYNIKDNIYELELKSNGSGAYINNNVKLKINFTEHLNDSICNIIDLLNKQYRLIDYGFSICKDIEKPIDNECWLELSYSYTNDSIIEVFINVSKKIDSNSNISEKELFFDFLNSKYDCIETRSIIYEYKLLSLGHKGSKMYYKNKHLFDIKNNRDFIKPINKMKEEDINYYYSKIKSYEEIKIPLKQEYSSLSMEEINKILSPLIEALWRFSLLDNKYEYYLAVYLDREINCLKTNIVSSFKFDKSFNYDTLFNNNYGIFKGVISTKFAFDYHFWSTKDDLCFMNFMDNNRGKPTNNESSFLILANNYTNLIAKVTDYNQFNQYINENGGFCNNYQRNDLDIYKEVPGVKILRFYRNSNKDFFR